MSFELSFGIRLHGLSIPLVDITPEGCRAREEIAAGAGLLQGAGALGVCAGIATTVAGACLSRQYPIAGSLTSATGVFGAFASREVYLFGRNVRQIMNDDLLVRTAYASHPYKFEQALTRDTFVIGPIFGPSFVRELKESNGYS